MKVSINYKILSLIISIVTMITACQQFTDINTENSKMDEIFINDIVGSEIEIYGLQLEQISQGEMIDFNIYNHSDESVVFKDRTFSVQGFCPDTQNMEWKTFPIIFVQTNQQPSSVTLPPNLNVFDREVYNSLAFFRIALEESGCDVIRLFIVGKGSISNKSYGAYIDIDLTQ